MAEEVEDLPLGRIFPIGDLHKSILLPARTILWSIDWGLIEAVMMFASLVGTVNARLM